MPRREYHFWVYILSSRSRNLYTGITNNLLRRTQAHAEADPTTHTGKYSIHRLVYFKHFTRAQKIDLIEATNPTWADLTPCT